MPTESFTQQRTALVVRAEAGNRARAFGGNILFKLGAAETAGAMSLGLAVVQPGDSPPLHVHENEDEVFIILDGEYRVYADGAWSDAGPGSVVYLPRGGEHTFTVIGPGPGRHWVMTTSGGFERYFTRCAEVFAESGPPDVARLGALGAEFGMYVSRS